MGITMNIGQLFKQGRMRDMRTGNELDQGFREIRRNPRMRQGSAKRFRMRRHGQSPGLIDPQTFPFYSVQALCQQMEMLRVVQQTSKVAIKGDGHGIPSRHQAKAPGWSTL